MKSLTLAAAAMMMAGCVPSLHPLYTGKDLAFDPALLGAWQTKDAKDRQTWEFKPNEHSGYTLVHTEKGEARPFTVHLLALGGERFLDLYPDELEITNTFYAAFLVPVHMFARVRRKDDIFEIRFLSDDWLKKSIQSKSLRIAHEKLKDFILLTAPTSDLQSMIRGALAEPKAFPEAVELRRVP